MGFTQGSFKIVFQKDLIVWKHTSSGVSVGYLRLFQKDLIVWKPGTIHFIPSYYLAVVSEGLNSVETRLGGRDIWHKSTFQKDLIVWKLIRHGVIMARIVVAFQKDLIVWKLLPITSNSIGVISFQKDLIVWKLVSLPLNTPGNDVSEGLNSVETRTLQDRYMHHHRY